MAIVLTCHLVETVWNTHKQGLLAPFIVLDHNGQQHQTDVLRAAGRTVWNCKAQFPYSPSSDLVIMAFDAGGRQPGAFVAQAVVDAAAMLQDGSLSATAALVNKRGHRVGEVLFDIALSTSSRGLAAGLSIPSLTLAEPPPSSPGGGAKARGASPQQAPGAGRASPFALPEVQHTLHGRQDVAAAPHASREEPGAPETPSSAAHRLVESLSQVLGFGHYARSRQQQPDEAAAAPAGPRTAHSPSALLGGGAACERSGSLCSSPSGFSNHLQRRSFQLRMGSSSPQPPPVASPSRAGTLTRSRTAAQSTSFSAWGSGPLAAAAPLFQGHAIVPAGSLRLPPAELEGGPGRTASSSSCWSPAGRAGSLAVEPSERAMSPLSAARSKLRLVRRPSTPVSGPSSPAARSPSQQLRQQQAGQQLPGSPPSAQASGAACGQPAGGCAAAEAGPAADYAALLREYEAADAAGKEAILFRELRLQQAERHAGTAQILGLIARQQQQESAQQQAMLATLAAMGSGSSRAGTASSPEASPTTSRAAACRTAFKSCAGGSSATSSSGFATGSSSGGSGSPMSRYYPELPTFAELHKQQWQQQEPPSPSLRQEEEQPGHTPLGTAEERQPHLWVNTRPRSRQQQQQQQQEEQLAWHAQRAEAQQQQLLRQQQLQQQAQQQAQQQDQRRQQQQQEPEQRPLEPPQHSLDLTDADSDSSPTAVSRANKELLARLNQLGRPDLGPCESHACGTPAGVASFPISNNGTELSEAEYQAELGAPECYPSVAHGSGPGTAPAYACVRSPDGPAGYAFARADQAKSGAAGSRWHGAAPDVLPYARPLPAFPQHSVAIQPSAPPAEAPPQV